MFKSDRGGIEMMLGATHKEAYVKFKSDRGGIEMLLLHYFLRLYIRFKSDRGGIEIRKNAGVGSDPDRSNQTVAGLKLGQRVYIAPATYCLNQTVAGSKRWLLEMRMI